MVSLYPIDLQTRVEGVDTSLEKHGIFTKVVDGIKIHAIVCGWIKYRNAHVHSSLGPYFVLLDPTWMDWSPIYSWVIEHPEGTIVIDTGETVAATSPDYLRNAGMNGWLNKQLARFNVSESSDLKAQLNRLNIQPENVRWVVLTHLHIDHAGGLKYFPKSEIVVSHQEYIRPYAFVEQTFPAWFDPHLIGHFEETGDVFENGYVLSKAGDVVIVPTPGHTPHHQSVIFKTRNVNFFFAGDASFSYGHMKSKIVPGINADRAAAYQTLLKIQEFCEDYPTLYLPSHDQKSVTSFFTDRGSPYRA